jgi:hypothetical protein
VRTFQGLLLTKSHVPFRKVAPAVHWVHTLTSAELKGAERGQM